MRVVFGIGNPGPEYEPTRHNLGFRVVDRLAAARQAPFALIEGLEGVAAATELAGEPALLVKPLTYVNRCGRVLAGLADRHGLDPVQLLVVVDDFQLPLGRLRLRGGGSDGGHNGLASILWHLETPDVPRLRIGIGSPPEELAVSDFVLRAFLPEEEPEAARAVEAAAGAVETWAEAGLERAMAEVNRRDLDQPPERA